jgi:hypothetical protein
MLWALVVESEQNITDPVKIALIKSADKSSLNLKRLSCSRDGIWSDRKPQHKPQRMIIIILAKC